MKNISELYGVTVNYSAEHGVLCAHIKYYFYEMATNLFLLFNTQKSTILTHFLLS